MLIADKQGLLFNKRAKKSSECKWSGFFIWTYLLIKLNPKLTPYHFTVLYDCCLNIDVGLEVVSSIDHYVLECQWPMCYLWSCLLVNDTITLLLHLLNLSTGGFFPQYSCLLTGKPCCMALNTESTSEVQLGPGAHRVMYRNVSS